MQIVQAGAIEFNELADHALGAQHFRYGQDEIRRRGARRQLAGQLHANHFGQQHGNGLAEHGRLGLDTANAPAQDSQAVDHRGMAVGADQGIGIGDGLAAVGGGPGHLRQIFDVDLMANAGAGRHHAEIVKGALAPAQKGIAFAVALELQLDVLGQRIRRARMIHHHRMIDHQIDGGERINLFRIAAHGDHGGAHGGQVDHRRHAGEILHQHPGRAIGDFLVGALIL